MKDAKYFIAIEYENQQMETHSANCVINVPPLKWIKDHQNPTENVKRVTLLWWKQLTEEEEKEAVGIGEIAF